MLRQNVFTIFLLYGAHMATPIKAQTSELKPVIKVHRIYTKGSVFETAAPKLALIENPPPPIIDLQFNINAHLVENNIYEPVLTLNVTAKHNDSIIWKAQVHQAGMYTLENFKEEQRNQVLNGVCINQIYPYALAVLNQLINQGGFAAVYMNPMNFEQIYVEQQKQQKEVATEEAKTAPIM